MAPDNTWGHMMPCEPKQTVWKTQGFGAPAVIFAIFPQKMSL